jgi:5-methylcytosine-specific restriction endonuclease McrA
LMTTEQRKDYNAAYWKANKERLAPARARWAVEKATEISRRRTSETCKQCRRLRYAQRIDVERERRRVWARANKPHRTRRARKKANSTGAAVRHVDYEAILRAWDRVCHICRELVPFGAKVHFDHVIPLAKGGPHTPENIRPAHAVCNLRKQDKVMS